MLFIQFINIYVMFFVLVDFIYSLLIYFMCLFRSFCVEQDLPALPELREEWELEVGRLPAHEGCCQDLASDNLL